MHGGEQASYSSGSSLKFGLPITSILNSVVTLTVNADAVTLVDNVSPGKIQSAQVCQFNNATCGSFQALTQRGYLTATVQNAGSIAAAFIVSVRHASVSFRMTLRLTSEREKTRPVGASIPSWVCHCRPSDSTLHVAWWERCQDRPNCKVVEKRCCNAPKPF